jgi:hypothetical protein
MVRDRGYDGEAIGAFEEVPYVDSPHEGDCRFEFYNVLWISWVMVSHTEMVSIACKKKEPMGIAVIGMD